MRPADAPRESTRLTVPPTRPRAPLSFSTTRSLSPTSRHASLQRASPRRSLSNRNWLPCTGTSARPFATSRPRRGGAWLSSDLKGAFPSKTGFSAINPWRMRQMYETYTSPDFLSQFVREAQPRRKAAKGPPAAPWVRTPGRCQARALALALAKEFDLANVSTSFGMTVRSMVNRMGIANYRGRECLPDE
jgi:hypothetical protein